MGRVGNRLDGCFRVTVRKPPDCAICMSDCDLSQVRRDRKCGDLLRLCGQVETR